MSANQPTSFRYPFKHSDPETDQMGRLLFNGTLDLNNAIRSLTNKFNALKATPAGTTTTTTTQGGGGGGGSISPSVGGVNDQTGNTSYILQQTDFGGLVILNTPSIFALDLNTGITAPFYCVVQNFGTAMAILTPDTGATVNGTANFYLLAGQAALLFFDGRLNWWVTTLPPIQSGGTFFLDTAASDIATYKELINTFPTAGETTLSASGTSGSGNVLIGAFATNPGYPGITLIPAGMWTPSLFVAVDSLTQGPSIVIELYTRSGSVETLQGSLTFPLTATAVTLYTPSLELGNISVLPTDRLVTKVYLLAGGASSRTATLYFDGTVNNSHIHTPASVLNVPAPLGGTSGSLGGSPMTAGQTITATVTVTGAATTMAVVVSPQTDPGAGFVFDGFVSSANTVTVRLTATLSATPSAALYNVRVMQ